MFEHCLSVFIKPEKDICLRLSYVVGLSPITHQSDEEKEDLEAPAEGGHTGDIAVAHRGHGHHEKVNAVPVREELGVLKVRRVPRVFQLK